MCCPIIALQNSPIFMLFICCKVLTWFSYLGAVICSMITSLDVFRHLFCPRTHTDALRIFYPLFSPYDIYIDSWVERVGFLYCVFICRRKLNFIDLDLKCRAAFYIRSKCGQHYICTPALTGSVRTVDIASSCSLPFKCICWAVC